MRRVRVIPTLLIKDTGLVKSTQFKNQKYVGDPINAVRIFNEKEVDELVILDLSATIAQRAPDLDRIREIASEAFMPIAYGGGITSVEQVQALISSGVEKVVINSAFNEKPSLVRVCSDYVGSQSVVVSIDVRKNIWGKYQTYTCNGSVNTGKGPLEYAREAERMGAGEIILNSIERDGTLGGYDLDLLRLVAHGVDIPVVALGGASCIADFESAIANGASAVAAGSMFVFKGPHRAVLISYPSQEELREGLFEKI